MRTKDKDFGQAREPLEAIVYPEAVSCFANEYECVATEDEAEVVMDVEAQRDYFDAWPQMGGEDPLPVYVSMLAERGYRRKKNFEGESCYFLRAKVKG